MKAFLIIFSLILMITEKSLPQTPKNREGAKSTQGYIISGSIKGTDSAFASLYDPQSDPHRTSYAIVKHGKFEFKGLADTPQLLTLTLRKKGYKNIFFMFYAENTQMTITADFDDPDNIIIM